jgi:hypothetical protein
MPILDQVITNVYNAINAGSYFRSTTEMQSAISLANTQLYQKFRGNMAQYQKNSPKAILNFGETTITLDSLAELYRTYLLAIADPLIVVSTDNQVVDIAQSIELQVTRNGPFYSVQIVPDNQYNAINQNKVIPPTIEFPRGRLYSFLTYEIVPSINNYIVAVARTIVLPKEPVFTLIDTGGPIPQINITQDLVWTQEKIPALVMLTIQNLGFTLQNGVLIQGAASLNAQSL